MSTPVSTLGIDAGATLCKLALINQGLETALLPSKDIAAVRQQIESWAPDRVVATGGGAAQLAAEIPSLALRRVGEVEAWARGAPVLARRDGVPLPQRYLLVSLGTGTSVLMVGESQARRIGGCALGGGTLVGLGRLLLGAKSFREVLALAAQGERGEVDLLVGDVYPAGGAPLPPQATAANFGKLASQRPEDLARALIGLVGENVGLLIGELGRTHDIECVVYAGSTLTDNPLLQQILGLVASLQGRAAHFLSDAAYCGAVGAAALADA